jgi:hypothetical protein
MDSGCISSRGSPQPREVSPKPRPRPGILSLTPVSRSEISGLGRAVDRLLRSVRGFAPSATCARRLWSTQSSNRAQPSLESGGRGDCCGVWHCRRMRGAGRPPAICLPTPSSTSLGAWLRTVLGIEVNDCEMMSRQMCAKVAPVRDQFGACTLEELHDRLCPLIHERELATKEMLHAWTRSRPSRSNI